VIRPYFNLILLLLLDVAGETENATTFEENDSVIEDNGSTSNFNNTHIIYKVKDLEEEVKQAVGDSAEASVIEELLETIENEIAEYYNIGGDSGATSNATENGSVGGSGGVSNSDNTANEGQTSPQFREGDLDKNGGGQDQSSGQSSSSQNETDKNFSVLETEGGGGSSSVTATTYDEEFVKIPDFLLVLKLTGAASNGDAVELLEATSIVLSNILKDMSQTFKQVLLDIQIQDQQQKLRRRKNRSLNEGGTDVQRQQQQSYHHVVVNIQGSARFLSPALSTVMLERAIMIAFSTNELVNLLQQGGNASSLSSIVASKVFLGNAAMIIEEHGSTGDGDATDNDSEASYPTMTTDGPHAFRKFLFGVALITVATAVLFFIVASLIWRRRRLLRWEINNLKHRQLGETESWDDDIMAEAKFPDIDLEKTADIARSEVGTSIRSESFVLPDMSPDVDLESTVNSERFLDYQSDRQSTTSKNFPDIAWETSTTYSKRLGGDDDDAFSITDTAFERSVYGGDD
jgi:hypothetical protein